jgi:hypothetical protein
MKFLRNRWLQLSAVSALLAGIGIIALRLKYSVLDYDIWWHLKVGDWIVDNLSLPHSGILSRTAAARPWVAYSWGIRSTALPGLRLVRPRRHWRLWHPPYGGRCRFYLLDAAAPLGPVLVFVPACRDCLLRVLVQRHAAPGLLFNDAVLRDAHTSV